VSLKEKLIEKLKGRIPSQLLPLLPSRYPIIGNVALIRLKEQLLKYEKEIGEAVLEVLNVRAVWRFAGKTEGVIRTPRIIHLAGDPNPIVIHKELGTLFKLDISKLLFSPGNAGEREKLTKIISKDDVVLDLFCCCGNLSMPVAVNVKPKIIVGVEINPLAFKYLLETIRLNKVSHIFMPINIDNHYWSEENFATQVLLGFLPRPDEEQLRIGIRSILWDGGTLHYHVALREEELMEEREYLMKTVKREGYKIINMSIEKIKGIAPRINHYVFRIKLRRSKI